MQRRLFNHLIIKAIFTVLIAGVVHAEDGQTWNGLVVAPEHRCSPYNYRDYHYPQSVEPRIVSAIGKVYGPYTGRCFAGIRQTDIEHIVARSEAHDSGLCAVDRAMRRRFASDLLNLTLASPKVNRCSKSGKCAKDAAEWMPDMNQCWFAALIIKVRRKYGLTIDRREADALEQVLSSCPSTELVVHACAVGSPASSDPPASHSATALETDDALGLWDDNRNGRITCREAQRRDEICPVIPFPSREPRRGDLIVDSYRQILFDDFQVEPLNILHACEFNLNPARHLVSSQHYRNRRPLAFASWEHAVAI